MCHRLREVLKSPEKPVPQGLLWRTTKLGESSDIVCLGRAQESGS